MDLRRGTETVLVVDDEDMIMELARDILVRYGYTVLTANCGKDAVEVYRKNKDVIAAVLLDIVMDDLDGTEVFRQIREIDPVARVLISSGYDQERDAEELLRKGAVGFVQKPYRINELVKAVGEVMQQA